MNRLDGKIAVVTGGAQGLGAAIAHRFADVGAAGLVICGRNADKGAAVARDITERRGVLVHFTTADLSHLEDCAQVVAAADQAFGRVDVLVNAAAQPVGRLLDPAEVARAAAFLASGDSWMMTGAVIHFDQSVWGGYDFGPPTPAQPLRLQTEQGDA